MMKVSTVGVVAFDGFNECRAVFGCAVRGTDVAAIVIKTVKRQNAGKRVFLLYY